MPLKTTTVNAAGILGLEELPFPPGFSKYSGGAPILPADEKAIVEAWATLSALAAPVVGTAHYTYTVATLAARPAIATVGDGVLVFVQSQKSWYRSDLAGNVWRREPIADAAWQAVTTWEIDPAGSVEASGAPGFPIPFEELVARLPVPTQNITVNVVAGAALQRLIWQMLARATAAALTVTIAGVRTLGGNLLVATSSDETATQAPRVDAGVALTIGSLVQATDGATSGATAAVTRLIAGTNYETSPWRTAGGARAVPPAGGAHIAAVTLPTCVFWGVGELGNITVAVDNLAIANLGDRVSDFQRFRTCTFTGAFAGAIATRSVNFSNFSGCCFALGLTCRQTVFIEYCGFVQSVASSECTFNAGCGQSTMNDSVCSGLGVIARDGGAVNLSRVGVMASTGGAGLQVIRTAIVRLTGTLYGSGNAVGTLVDDAGNILCDTAVTPTMAAAGNELIIDGEANQVPALGTGGGAGAVPAAAACNTWAAFKAAPFSGNVRGRLKGSSVLTT